MAKGVRSEPAEQGSLRNAEMLNLKNGPDWRAGCYGNGHVRFGGGRSEKGWLQYQHLAGLLPYPREHFPVGNSAFLFVQILLSYPLALLASFSRRRPFALYKKESLARISDEALQGRGRAVFDGASTQRSGCSFRTLRATANPTPIGSFTIACLNLAAC